MIYNSYILSFQVEKNTSELEIGSEYQLFLLSECPRYCPFG